MTSLEWFWYIYYYYWRHRCHYCWGSWWSVTFRQQPMTLQFFLLIAESLSTSSRSDKPVRQQVSTSP